MNSIKQMLDDAFASRKQGELPPVPVINGMTGSGKTPIILEWIEEHGLSYYHINTPCMKPYELEVEYFDWKKMMGGKDVAIVGKIETTKEKREFLFTPEQIDELDNKQIIFVDDYDWGSYATRQHLWKMMVKSVVEDPREEDNGFIKPLKNVLMFIVVTHPEQGLGDPYDEKEERAFGKHLF